MQDGITKTKRENWINSKWRPAMGWVYMITCTCDFILFPVIWTMLQSATGINITQWNPITLQGAGLYHVAMGAVLGVTAWSRGQEKMNGVASGYGGYSPSNLTRPHPFNYNNMYRSDNIYSNDPYTNSFNTNTNRQLSERSRRIIPDNDPGDADNRLRIDPEVRS